MSAVELLKRANAVTMASFVRPGMEVPLEAARTLGAAWPAFLDELASHGLRAEFALDCYVIREGAPQPITGADVEALL